MRLGTETGSLVNYVMANAGEPQVGGAATLLSWTDRDPATVIGWDGKIATVQADQWQRIDTNGMSEAQEYRYTPDPDGYVSYWRRARKGGWERIVRNPETGRWRKCSGGIAFGSRERYYDYSF